MKELIKKESKYIESIGKTLGVEKYNDGTKFYYLIDRHGNVNVADTSKSYEEIKERIDLWNDLVARNVIAVR